MRRFHVPCVGLFLVSLLAVNPAAAAGNSKYIEGALAALPIPAVGEFSTPEKVIRAYVQALDQNDLDAGLKCFPLREMYDRVSWDVEAQELLTFQGTRAFAGMLELMRYRKMIEGFGFPWFQVNLYRMRQKNKDSVLEKGLKMSANPTERRRQIDGFARFVQKGLATRVELATFKVFEPEPPGPIALAIGAAEQLVAIANTKLGGEPMELDFTLVKIGTNYRILMVMANPPPGQEPPGRMPP